MATETDLQTLGFDQPAVSSIGTNPQDDLPYNLRDDQQRGALKDLIERCIEEDNAEHRKYYAEWNEADDNLNGETTPVGFTEEHSKALAEANDPTAKKRILKEFVSVNRARPNHESVLGDFSAQRRRLIITGRHPTQRNLGIVFQERVRAIEDTEQLPELVYFPAYDNAFAKGQHWIKITYDPFARKLRGKYDIRDVNVRDVLIDATCRSAYYERARRLTHRMQFSEDEAITSFSKYPLYDASRFYEDQEYDEPYGRSVNRIHTRMATYYEFHFLKPTQVYYQGSPQSPYDFVEITKAEYLLKSQSQIFRDFVFPGGVEDRWYIALYNRQQGVFHLERNYLDMPTLIPVLNIQSDSRLYCIGDVKGYSQLGDLLNVLVTVFTENAKRANIPIIPVDPEAWTEYQGQLEDATYHGGPAPGARGVYYAQPINEALAMLIPWVLNWIQDSASKHSASMGELPAKQIAKETVQTLIAKDRQSHGRKDVMLKYALTRLAQAIVRLINLMESEPGYFHCVDPNPSTLGYVPINQTWTEQEYLAAIAALSKLPPPRSPDELAAFQQQLSVIREKFEEVNDVRSGMSPGYLIEHSGGIKEVTLDGLQKILEQSNLTPDEFTQIYNVQATMVKVYKVNDITQDVDFVVTYGIDDDHENDPTFKANKALMSQQRGAMSRVDMMKELGYLNAEQIVDRADQEQQIIGIAKALAANPELMQYVQQLLSNPELVQNLLKVGSNKGNREQGKE